MIYFSRDIGPLTADCKLCGSGTMGIYRWHCWGGRARLEFGRGLFGFGLFCLLSSWHIGVLFLHRFWEARRSCFLQIVLSKS